jgi:malate dehydrogenase (oxaloacetate-decarboxylating)
VRIGQRRQEIAQCNNVYVFPGLGLGITAARATRVTDAMFTAAATAVGADAPLRRDQYGALLPPQTQLVDIATAVARAVALAAVADGVAPEHDATTIDEAIERTRWTPAYPELSSTGRVVAA